MTQKEKLLALAEVMADAQDAIQDMRACGIGGSSLANIEQLYADAERQYVEIRRYYVEELHNGYTSIYDHHSGLRGLYTADGHHWTGDLVLSVHAARALMGR